MKWNMRDPESHDSFSQVQLFSSCTSVSVISNWDVSVSFTGVSQHYDSDRKNGEQVFWPIGRPSGIDLTPYRIRWLGRH